MNSPSAITGAVLLLLTSCSAIEAVHAEPMRLGVTTHFSQGWPIRLMDSARSLGVVSIRDSLHWAAIEQVPGRHVFADAKSRHIDMACRAGMSVLLGIDPRNRIYDGGFTAHSPVAQQAFANYVHAIAERYKGCVVAIEIGNEINGRNGMTGAAAVNRAASHTALLKAVHQRVKPSHPELALIGGSTNVIGTGFLAKLFAAGALDYMDGVAVHPYRNTPEGVEWELDRLKAAMVRAGQVKPIWITEFSKEFAKPEDAAPFLLKMIALANGAGVSHFYWYALIDQKWFPTMGLLTLQGTPKPGAKAFAYAAANLATQGTAVRVPHDDTTLFHYRFGADHHLVWGTRRSFTASGQPTFRRADGSIVVAPTEISDEPLLVQGPTEIAFGEAEVLADSLLTYGRSPFSYHAKRANGAIVPLRPIDWTWTTYIGTPSMPLMIVNPEGIGPVGGGRLAVEAVVRYTSPKSVSAIASLCLRPLGLRGDGANATLTLNGTMLKAERVSHLTGEKSIHVPVSLKAGDSLDFSLGPVANALQDRMAYRFRVSKSLRDIAQC